MDIRERVGKFIQDTFIRPPIERRPPAGLTPDQRMQFRSEQRAGVQGWHTRRRVIIGGVLFVAGSALAYAELNRIINLFPDPQQPEPQQFSGEIEETKNLVEKWDREVGTDAKKLKEYLPKIRDLMVAYFSKQRRYPKEQFDNKIELLDAVAFYAKARELGSEDIDQHVPIFSAVIEGKAYVNTDLGEADYEAYTLTGGRAKLAAFAFLHEFHHMAPPLKYHPSGKKSIGASQPVVYERGLLALTVDTQKSTPGNTKYIRNRESIEEVVADHGNEELASKINLDIHTVYSVGVQRYQVAILDTYYQAKGDELFGHHQHTEPEEFFQAIGSKLQQGKGTPKEQEEKGYEFVQVLLPVTF